MKISEKKMQIVINNYFKQECDVNTSIHEAFERGFRIGVEKASSTQPEQSFNKWKKDFKGFVEMLDMPKDDFNGIMNYIDEAPFTQPERQTGQWVERWHDNKHVIGDMACSVCGSQMLLTFPRFCPNCGAYMRKEKDGKTC